MAACEPENVTEAPPTPEAAPEVPVLTEVRLPVLQVLGDLPRAAEVRGLLTLSLELGLGDIPGVVPRLGGDAEPWSIATDPPVPRRMVDARFVARGTAEALTLELELCEAGAGCHSTEAVGSTADPWQAMGALLDGAADGLGVPVDEVTRDAWRQPVSRDDYAELITGRACAMYLGLLPPSLLPGDKREDPVTKAVFLDPQQALAQWVRARWELASTPDGGRGPEYLQRASLLRPTSPLIAAEAATVQGLAGHAPEAVLAWEELRARWPGDPRFEEPWGRALFRAGRLEEARTALDALPPEFGWTPAIAALRVDVAEGLGGAEIDELLEKWQRVDAGAVSPVRRRIELRVRSGAYEEALALISTLRPRAPGPDTDALHVALLVATGGLAEAVARAPAEVSVRLEARRRLEADPGSLPEGLPEDDALALMSTAAGLLRAAQAGPARTYAEAASALDPVAASPWTLRARALEMEGNTPGAVLAWGEAWDRDPASEGGPVSQDRVASTFRFVEQGMLPDEVLEAQGVGGEKGPEL
jgi:tetratricopeptide (TPR) repeat protein